MVRVKITRMSLSSSMCGGAYSVPIEATYEVDSWECEEGLLKLSMKEDFRIVPLSFPVTEVSIVSMRKKK